MALKVTWYLIWPQRHMDILNLAGQIMFQSNVKWEISAIEILVTSCMRDCKWHRKVVLRNISLCHSAFYLSKFHLNPIVNDEYMAIIHIDDVILRWTEIPLSATTVESLKWFGQKVTELWMDNPNYKERVCMHFTGIARYSVIFTCKLKCGHNFWTNC